MSTYSMWIIRRRKFGGSVWHYGLLLPDGRVIEFSDKGVQAISTEAFSAGQDVEHVRQVSMNKLASIQQRLNWFHHDPKPYDLAGFNCETFVNWLVGDIEPKSEQVRVALTLAAIAAFAFFLARSS